MAIPSKIQSRLLDTACDLLASKIESRLTWLTAYGKVDTITEGKGRDEVTFPAIFDGGKTGRSMLALMPDKKLGNFMFIRVDDEHDISLVGNVINIEADIEMVFWWNYEKVYPTDHQNRTIENIKYDIFKQLKKGITGVRLELEDMTVAVGDDEVFRGYTQTDKDRGYLKRPYGALVIRTKIYYTELCD